MAPRLGDSARVGHAELFPPGPDAGAAFLSGPAHATAAPRKGAGQ
ncbi:MULTISPECIES: hypothetical protein [unclassified Streptomyces]|nr:hypothetical protein [Streptomyces sp. NBC_00334]